jgi:hypothetical protein
MAVTYYAAYCFPNATATPYLPVRDLLRQMCGLPHGPPHGGHRQNPGRSRRRVSTQRQGHLCCSNFSTFRGAAERLASLSPPARRAQTCAPVADVPALQSTTPVDPDRGESALIDTTSEAWLQGGGTADRRGHLASGDLSAQYRSPWFEYSPVTHMTLPSAVGGGLTMVPRSYGPHRSQGI